MRVSAIYRKSLEMTADEIATQVAYAIVGLGVTDRIAPIYVDGVDDAKFKELIDTTGAYVETSAGVQLAAAWINQ